MPHKFEAYINTGIDNLDCLLTNTTTILAINFPGGNLGPQKHHLLQFE